MAIYRNIHVSFWSDPFVLELTPEKKYFFLYLMTNSKTQQSGIYELPKSIIQFETGYNSETVDKLLKTFIEFGKIRYDEETKEIMLVNWLKYNYSRSPKVINCIEKEVKSIKSTFLKKELDRVCIEYGYSIDTLSQEEEEKNKKKNKKIFAEFVKMTEEEHNKLVSKYGKDNTLKFIDKLNNYKGSTGKIYKSDYRAILSWVVEKIIKDSKSKGLELNT